MMNPNLPETFTAFAGTQQIACGYMRDVVHKVQAKDILRELAPVLIFDDISGEVVDIDPRGTQERPPFQTAEIETGTTPKSEPTLPAKGARGPGRPRLGVVAREVTLLPRHWDWLGSQPGGASVALRKLVEEARRANQGKDRLRLAREAAYRFMSAMAGNEPGFEEAARALFGGDQERFAEFAEPWPIDVRNYAKKLAGRAFERSAEQVPQTKPRYTLDELLTKCDDFQPRSPEEREWIDAPAVGRELL
jgi:uncharacterized protein